MLVRPAPYFLPKSPIYSSVSTCVKISRPWDAGEWPACSCRIGTMIHPCGRCLRKLDLTLYTSVSTLYVPRMLSFIRKMFEIQTMPLDPCRWALDHLLVARGQKQVSLGDIYLSKRSKLKTTCPSDYHHRALNRRWWAQIRVGNSPNMMVRWCFVLFSFCNVYQY